MALNIPINLMSAGTPPASSQTAEPQTGPEQSASVQPSAQSSASGDAAGNNNNSSGQASSEQQAATRRASRAVPDSVVTAQAKEGAADVVDERRQGAVRAQDAARTKALIDAIAVTPADKGGLLDRPKEVDRYAPPDPLPTAPILAKAPPTAIKPPAE